MIGTEDLKYVDNTKYLGTRPTFCETMKDDKDMIRQTRLLYTESNKLLRLINHCTTDIKLVLLIALTHSYTVHFYGLITLNAHLANL